MRSVASADPPFEVMKNVGLVALHGIDEIAETDQVPIIDERRRSLLYVPELCRIAKEGALGLFFYSSKSLKAERKQVNFTDLGLVGQKVL